jgi:hypothetical protein
MGEFLLLFVVFFGVPGALGVGAVDPRTRTYIQWLSYVAESDG